MKPLVGLAGVLLAASAAAGQPGPIAMTAQEDKDQNAQRTDHADRQVDVEDPAPAVVIGQPAAERRPPNLARGLSRYQKSPLRARGAPAD